MAKHTHTPKFSVIIPTYNRELIVLNVIQAVLQQSEQDFEIIIIDDGSKDRTVETIRTLNDDRIKIFEQTNKGCSIARSNGCDQASGEWLAFCDSDDIWAPEYLQEVSKAIGTYNTDVVFTNYQVEGEDKPRIDGKYAKDWISKWSIDQNSRTYLCSENFYDGLLEWQPTFPSAFTIRTSFYHQIGGIKKDLNRVRSEDGHLVRRAAAHGRYAYIARNLVTLGRQEDNLSSNYLRNLCGGVSHLERFIARKEIPEQYFESTIREIINHHKQICDQAFWAKDYKQSLASASVIPFRQWTVRTLRNYIISFTKQWL